MRYLAFAFFLSITVFYIWNGKDCFNKKEWVLFGLKFLASFCIMFILAIVFKFFATVVGVISVSTGRNLTVMLWMSINSFFMNRFLIVMIGVIFSRIILFHRDHNKDNYPEIDDISKRFGPPLFLLAKCLISLGSILIFYGIWLSGSFG
ncbi:hypothetical protein D0N50_19310 [Erwinia billingiae]|nr:hypothetical protein D0N50_19310 [Erwinia billingiae]